MIMIAARDLKIGKVLVDSLEKLILGLVLYNK